jgi:hypothetical protein
VESDTNPVTDFVDEFQIKGEEVLAKVRELVHEGNVRRIIILNNDGRTVLEVPLTVGVVGALLLPTAAAIGAVAALVTDCTIKVVREEESADDIPEVVEGEADAGEESEEGADAESEEDAEEAG